MIGKRELQRTIKVLLESYLAHRTDHWGRIVLNFDSTDDPTRGQQEFSGRP